MAPAAASRGLRLRRWWAMHHLQQLSEARRRWVHLRLLGWALLLIWQMLSLASEFFPIIDPESKALRVAGKMIGLVGLFLVAWGFERLMHLAAPPKPKVGDE